MPYRNDAKDLENKLAKTVSDGVKAVNEALPELKDIKENVKDLATSVREASVDAADYVQNRAYEIKEAGVDSWSDLERRIKKNPGQSIAIAFAAGILASFIFSGRR